MKGLFTCWVFFGGILLSHGGIVEEHYDEYDHHDLPVTLPDFDIEDKAKDSSRCGEYWEEDPNSGVCYRVPDTLLNWADAKAYCKSLGRGNDTVDLCSVLSVSENYFISSIISYRNPKPDKGTWIGYYYYNGWKWSDGSPVYYSNFETGWPKPYKNCAYIGETFPWFNADCNAGRAYPCCKKIVG